MARSSSRIRLQASALIFAAACGLGASSARAQDPVRVRPPNGLALTPPMGWNSWNRFGCDISEDKIKAQADAMVANGLKAAGYQYLVIDDCWQVARDSHGDILADPKRFPSGVKALADYIHLRGLKFGIYSDVGDGTCQNRPGSRGHEYQDAAHYARWGVDYLKYDWCNTENISAPAAYETMADALRATGRPIVFSICEWGSHQPWLWAAAAGGNLWRTTPDIWDSFDATGHQGDWLSVLDIIDRQAPLAAYAGPGHWNDPDMLEVGNGGMSQAEYRTHFALWAMMAAPLIAGNDLTVMPRETLAVLTAPEIIAIDQDTLGQQGRRVIHSDSAEVWIKPLSGGRYAVLLFNRSPADHAVAARLADLGIAGDAAYSVRDAWAEMDLDSVAGVISAQLAPHAAAVLVLKPRP